MQGFGNKTAAPDVNESDDNFTVVGDNIRFGLAAVKNTGRGFVRSLMQDAAMADHFIFR